MAEQGMIYDVDNIKRQLVESNRDYNNRLTWQSMIQGTNLSASTAQSELQKQYSSASSQAYSSYLSNQTALKNSGIVGSGVKSIEQQNTEYLQEAYNKYLSQLQSGSTAIESQRIQTQEGISEMLTEQATNIKDYATSQFDYLQHLYDTDPEMFKSRQWSKYMTSDIDPETGEALKGTERLMSREELLSARQNEAGEEIGLYDSEGNLTLKGLDFFDQIMNSPDLYDRSFGKFLGETDIDWLMEHNEGMTRAEAKKQAERNAELYEWSQSYNPFEYTEEGTMKGSFKEMVGLSSDDNKYSFIERFGGLTEKEIDTMYEDFHSLAKQMESVDFAKHGKGQVKEIQATTTQIFDIMRDLGIDGEMKKAGFDENVLNQIYELAIDAMQSNKEMNDAWWSKTLMGVGLGALTGGIAGAKAGVALNVVPLWGQAANLVTTIVGATLGGIAGGFIAAGQASEQKKIQKAINKQQGEASKSLYLDMLTEMTNFSQSVRRQAEVDFYFNK